MVGDTGLDKRHPEQPAQAAATAQEPLTVPFLVPLPPPGLAMFISGMVLWRTEGTHALIGLWVLGLLVFIPGFYFT